MLDGMLWFYNYYLVEWESKSFHFLLCHLVWEDIVSIIFSDDVC